MKKILENYYKSLILPEFPEEEIKFYSFSNLLIANNYERIVVGYRGAYIEFLPTQIEKNNIFVPDECQWRLNDTLCYYNEWQSKCNSKVFIYEQRKTVVYADYITGLFYISPILLTSEKYPYLIRT